MTYSVVPQGVPRVVWPRLWYTMACPGMTTLAYPGMTTLAYRACPTRPRLQGPGLRIQDPGFKIKVQDSGSEARSRVRSRIQGQRPDPGSDPGSKTSKSGILDIQLWRSLLLMFAPDSRIQGSWGEKDPDSIQSIRTEGPMTYCIL